jgi:Do/DeqQ family serine protease
MSANEHEEPAQPFGPAGLPPYRGPVLRWEPPPRVRLSWAIWALLLLVGAMVLPNLVERVRYAWTRGKERAEAEVAMEVLESGHGATIADYRYVAKRIRPSVVGVKAARIVRGQAPDELSFYFGHLMPYREQDQGSGVIMDAAGYVLTNNHVVDHASEVVVALSDGSQQRARIVGTDPATDLAVLKIEASGLMAATWGDSDALEAGDPVMAVGSPFGLGWTVTAGIISAKGRRAVVENVNYQDFLQADVAVNQGNSGGPLVDMKAEVVGINTAILGPTYQGISFAIPSNLVRHVYEQLVKGGKVARGWLGVSMHDLTAEQAEKLDLKGAGGALVTGVIAGSPAEEAGLRRGDVIIAWNGKPVRDRTELGLAVAWSKIGKKATVTVKRDGKESTFTVNVAERPEQLQANQ